MAELITEMAAIHSTEFVECVQIQ